MNFSPTLAFIPPAVGPLRETPPGGRRNAMIADAEDLRSESFEQIGTVIDRDGQQILDRWERCVVTEQPNTSRDHHASLR